MNKNSVPNPPKPFQITQKDKELVDSWIAFFRNLSPRIKVLTPEDDKFDLDHYKGFVIDHIGAEKVILPDWPEKKQVAFFLTFDSSFPDHPPEFLLKNCFIFSFPDKAFGLDYFEWDGDGQDNNFTNEYSLISYPNNALTWKYVSEIMIIEVIKELEDSVKGPPPKI